MACRNGCIPDWDEVEVVFEGSWLNMWTYCENCGDRIYGSTEVYCEVWLKAEGGPEDFD